MRNPSIRTLVTILALTVLGRGGVILAAVENQTNPGAKRTIDKAVPFVDWAVATPESQGMSSAKLDALWNDLKARNTTGFLVIRNDAVVYERYTDGFRRTALAGRSSTVRPPWRRLWWAASR